MVETLGKRIVIEGVDAAGKSYQARRLHVRLAQEGVRMCNFLIDEPDGAYRVDSLEEVMASEFWTDEIKASRSLVPEATKLRKLVKSKDANLTPEQNVEIFTQARELNWNTATLPALMRGESSVAARSEVSTTIYQGLAEGFGMDLVREITLRRLGPHYMTPDLLIILDFIDEAARQERLAMRGSNTAGDAFESRPDKFQQDILHGYRIHPKKYGGLLIPAEGTRDEVHEMIYEQARQIFDI